MHLIREIALAGADPDGDIRRYLPELLRTAGQTLLHLRRSEPRYRDSEWPWLARDGRQHLTLEDANKFLCASFLEFRAGKTDVWDNTAYFSDEVLEHPDNLWRAIVAHSPEGWNEQFWEYHLHPDPAVYARLRTVAGLMIRYYHGDARQIWEGFSDNPPEVFRRLKILDLPRSTCCLVIGALKDQGYLEGSYDIVGDVVDSRVLARIACGEGSRITPYQARQLARMICVKDPWILDRPLYVLGMSYCAPGPRCRLCPARPGCVYAVSTEIGVHIGTIVHEELFGQKTVQKSLKRWL